jgi:branched-chain amino acid aminotransferase
MLDPSVKSLNYLNNILGKIECMDAGVSEAIMLNDLGNVAEGTGDNVFIVKDGTVITPPASAGILMGVTRGLVLRLAAKIGVKSLEQDIKPAELFMADECFLTGSAAEIIAVTRVNDQIIGNGLAGPITQKLTKAFHEFTQA